MKIFSVQSLISFRVIPGCRSWAKNHPWVLSSLAHLTCSLQNSPFWLLAKSPVTLLQKLVVISPLASSLISQLVVHFYLPEIFASCDISETIFLLSHWTRLLSSLCFCHLLFSTFVLDLLFSLYTFSIDELIQPRGFSTNYMLMNSQPLFLALIFLLFKIIAVISNFIL